MIACKSTSFVEDPKDSVEVMSSEPQLLFVSYKFNGEELSLVNKIVTNGKLKTKPVSDMDMADGDLIFQQLDADKEVLSSVDIHNPRTRVVEYADDDGKFSKKTVQIEDPEFSLRVELELSTRYIAILAFTYESTVEEASILNLSEIK